MPKKAATRTFAVSQRYPAVEIHITVSVMLNTNEKYGAVGTHIDPSIVGTLPPRLQDVFFEEISKSVNVARTDAVFEIPSEGDLDVNISDLKILPFDEHMIDEGIESLLQNLRAITYETMVDLLGEMKQVGKSHNATS